MKIFTIYIFFTLVFINGVYSQNDFLTHFDEFASQAMNVMEVPGMAVSVVKDDSVFLSKGYGVKRIGDTDLVDNNTIFGIASISKSFTALAMNMLVAQGKINWDDKVNSYLPYFDMYDPFASKEISIKDLFLHHTGLPSICGGTIWYGSDYSRHDIVEKIKYMKPVAGFREKFAYQNIMYLVAGEIIYTITGQTWETFVKNEILTQLNMQRSSTTYQDLIKSKNLCAPHIKLNEQVVPVDFRNYNNMAPAAAINSTANDMAKYMMFLLNEGKINDSTVLLNKKSFDYFFSPQVALKVRQAPEELKHMKYNFKAYGFGWVYKDYYGKKVVYHTGSIDGMHSMIFLVPEIKLGITVLSNQETNIRYPVAYTIMDYFLKRPEFDYLSVYAKWQNQEEEEMIKRWKSKIKNKKSRTHASLDEVDYTGTYTDAIYGNINIRLEKGDLIIEFTHNKSFKARMEHWHYDTFLLNWTDPIIPKGFLTFVLNSDGEVYGFKLDQPELTDVNFDELNCLKMSKHQ